MGIKCRIVRNPNTNEIENVEAPNGADSNLFKDALNYTQSKEEALDLWGLSYTDNFKEVYGNSEFPQFSKVETPTDAFTIEQAVERNNNLPLTKAPNGKPSVLYQSYKDLGYTDQEAERLTAQVYSDNFKNWFGDWQNNPEKYSVVDNNGMPVLLFHGSDRIKEIQEFESNKGNLYSFFTNDISEAERYISNNKPDTQGVGKFFVKADKILNIREKKLRSYLINSSNMEEGIPKELQNFLKYNSDKILKEAEDFADLEAEMYYEVYKFLLDDETKTKKEIFQKWESLSSFEKIEKILKRGSNDWKILETDSVQSFLINNNYDAFVTNESDFNIAIYGKNNIKSATENIGTFSTQDNNIRRQIIGEKGAQSVKEYKNLLDKAKQLEKNNISLSDIADQTGWYKIKGDWRFFSNETLEQFKINENAITENTEQKLSDILPTESVIYDMYPDLRNTTIIVSQNPNKEKGASFDEERNLIETNLFNGRELEAAIAHEVQHKIQQEEGLPRGGNYKSLIQQLVGELSFIPKNVSIPTFALINELKKNRTSENKNIVDATLSLLEDSSKDNKYPIYRRIMGEIDAHMVTKAYTDREAPYSYAELLDDELLEQRMQETDAIVINSSGEVSFTPATEKTKNQDHLLNKLKETGLADNVYKLSNEEINQKLKELGFSEEQIRYMKNPTFFSNAAEAIKNLKDKNPKNIKGWINQLTNVQKNGGIRNVNQELDWIGLEDYLNEWVKENKPKNNNIPFEVIDQYIKDNQIEIVEVTKGSQDIKEQWEFLEQQQEEALNEGDYESAAFYEREIEKLNETATEAKEETKYPEYTLEGGENYREVLLTLPNKKTKLTKEQNDDYNKLLNKSVSDFFSLTDAEKNRLRFYKEVDNTNKKEEYKSSHWDESNVLAHLRLNERTLPNGERVLFIEEVQSDWAKESKKKGFKKTDEEIIKDSGLAIVENVEFSNLPENIQNELKEEKGKITVVETKQGDIVGVYFESAGKYVLDRDFNEFTDVNVNSPRELLLNYEKRRLGLMSYGMRLDKTPEIPQIPYQKTSQWVGMSMRKAMQMAAQEGFDRIAWTTGEQQFDRWGSSKISWEKQEDGSWNVDFKEQVGGQDDFTTIEDQIIKGDANVKTKEDFRDVVKNLLLRERGEYSAENFKKYVDTTANKIWGRMQSENKGQSLPRKEGMEGFYDGVLKSIARNEAKRFDKKAKVEVVEISQNDKGFSYEGKDISIEDAEKLRDSNSLSKEAQGDLSWAIIEVKTGKSTTIKDALNRINRFTELAEKIGGKFVKGNKSKQLSIPITPKMKDSFLKGVPQFSKDLNVNTAGFTYKNDVYLNKDVATDETSIHEFSHLYNKWLKQNRPEVYNRGIELVKEELEKDSSEISPIISYVKRTQPNLTGEALYEEVLTQLTGIRGINLIEKAAGKPTSKILNWVKEVWEQIKNLLGLSNMTTEQVMNLNIEEFADAAATDLLNNNVQNESITRQRNRTRWNPSRGYQKIEGAPIIKTRNNVTGADPELVLIAEQYAEEKGIDYKRQSEYVEVDVDRAKRIAQAYEDMKHEPENPKVKEAYKNLIKQTTEQYNALIKAGYSFYFYDETNDPYSGSPWAAMEDLRNNKTMAVFSTIAGYGSDISELNVSDNPMLEKTGFKWEYKGEMKDVLANDLFRAVHDAFGHGLEGAGFRARGEENAWQAHVRLFTGSAIGAITSETRGQNSWLNYGKYGEQNRTASVEETIFAEQKTGLMPEWTWKEGKSEDMKLLTEFPKFGTEEFNSLSGEQKANILGYTLNPKGSKISDVNGFKYPKKTTVNIEEVIDESIMSQAEKRILKASGVKTINFFGGRGSSEGVAFYNGRDNTINININNDIGEVILTNQEEVNTNIIHEIIHSVIANSGNQKQINEELQPIKEKLILNKGRANEYVKRIIYHIENGSNEEVLTYSLTIPELAQFMSNISSTKDVNFFNSLWHQFVEFIKSSLGTNNLLNESIEIINKYTTELEIPNSLLEQNPLVNESTSRGTKFQQQEVKPNPFTDENGEVKFQYVLDYLNEQNKPKPKPLTNQDLVEVENILRTKQITSTELSDGLSKLFSGGVLNTQALEQSDLFSKPEKRTILNSEDIQNNLYNLSENEITVEDNVEYNPEFLVFTGEQNKYGIYTTKNPLIVEEEIKEQVAGIEDYEEFSNAFNSIDYPDIVNKFNTDADFTFEMYSLYSPMTKVNLLDDNLEQKSTNRLTEVVNSLDTDKLDVVPMQMLLQTSDEVWNESQDEVLDALEDIEKSSRKAGLDLKGIEEGDKESIFNLLSSVITLKNNPSESSMEAFSEQYKDFFGIEDIQDQSIEMVDLNHANKELVRFDDTNKSEYDLFEQNQLIKIDNGLYQKVEDLSLDNLYEMVYAEAVFSDNRILPVTAYFNSTEINNQKLVDPQNKDLVLSNMREFISKNVTKLDLGTDNYSSEVAQKLLLNKFFFDAPINIAPIETEQIELELIVDFDGNTEQLTSDFITKFQEEKLNGKDFYQHFTIDENGIKLKNDNTITIKELQKTIPDNIKKDFRSYAALSKDKSIKKLFTFDRPQFIDLNTQRKVLQNNFKLADKINVPYEKIQGGLITKYNADFVRENNKLYQRVQTQSGYSIFREIPTFDENFNVLETENINKFSQEEITPYIRSQQQNETSNNFYTQEELDEINQKNFDC